MPRDVIRSKGRRDGPAGVITTPATECSSNSRRQAFSRSGSSSLLATVSMMPSGARWSSMPRAATLK